MKSGILSSVILTVVLSANLNVVFGLVENAVKEMACISPGVDTSLNWKWVYSKDKWYIPLWSKLELYRVAEDLIQKKVRDISEQEIEQPCVVSNKEFTTWGFNQTGVRFITQLDDDFVLHFESANGGMKGKYYMALTDNENFVVGITCWEDNQASWTVMSTKPYLNPGIKEVLVDYLKSHGFNMDFLVEDRYENCDWRNIGKTGGAPVRSDEL